MPLSLRRVLFVTNAGVILFGNGLNETSRRDFCLGAMRKRVVPGKSYGYLDEYENKQWRMSKCTELFCSAFVKGRCMWTEFGKNSVLENDRRVNENCGKRENSMTFLTTTPSAPIDLSALDAHSIEVMLAIGENSRHFAHVRVLVDRGEDDASATLLLRQAVYECQRRHRDKIDARASPTDLRKVTAHVFGKQPTYAEIFGYASEFVAGLVVLANADVVLRNLEAVDSPALQRDKLVLVLSISPPTGNYAKQCDGDDELASRCEFWDLAYGLSWDAYVFHSPLSLNYTFLDPPPGKSPIYMNAINAENCAGNFLVASGYSLANPCRTIKAEHWHCMGQKTHHGDSREHKWERECAQRMVLHRHQQSSAPIKITKSLTLGHVGGPGTLCTP